jgi:class III lanthionine synthetase
VPLDIDHTKSLLTTTSEFNAMPEHYGRLLDKYKLSYTVTGCHLQVGIIKATQGWLLHVSVIVPQMPVLLERLLPVLLDAGIPFKIIKSSSCHADLNTGQYGLTQVGKVLTIYPENDGLALEMAWFILARTADLAGPPVRTDLSLSPVLFARYGSFNPILKMDILGNAQRYIHNGDGELIPDQYSIPYQAPPGLPNPFTVLVQKDDLTSRKRLLSGNYMITKLLKADLKGNVYKAIHFTGMQFKTFVVKEGKKNMVADSAGRDMKDRLAWQNEVHQTLKEVVPIPKVQDFLEEGGHAYLVLENIQKGKDLGLHCFALMDNKPWFLIPIAAKLEIVSLMRQVVACIAAMHQHGYVHRDITVSNFLVSPDKKIHPIDLELAYSMTLDRPKPAYGVGTIGFMSPEQATMQMPAYADDIYSLGALIISLLTGIAPSYLLESDKQHLFDKLLFWIGYEPLVYILVSCVQEQRGDRPSLGEIQIRLSNYAEYLREEEPETPSLPGNEVSSGELLSVLQKGLAGLHSRLMVTGDGLWFSTYSGNNKDSNPLGDKAIYSGLYQGIGGVLYLLDQVHIAGFRDWIDPEVERANREYLQRNDPRCQSETPPGLYYGSAGVALSLAGAMSTGGPASRNQRYDRIYACLDRETPSLNLMYGAAGQGLAILQCAPFLDREISHELFTRPVTQLLTTQESDGSWIIASDDPAKAEKINGFGYGIAGIVYFLLEYGRRYQDKTALLSATKGLHYLQKVALRKKDHFAWCNGNKTRLIGGWWCHGGPGIALSFLKAYELWRDWKYLAIAERALQIHHEYFVNYNLGFCHGLSGLGEIYLEAYRATMDSRWKDRAAWIVNVLISLKRKSGNNAFYWLAEHSSFPTAGFMTGNSGILHFLLRYAFPDKLTFPFLPAPDGKKNKSYQP